MSMPNYWLISAALAMVLIAVVHTVLGEHQIFRPWHQNSSAGVSYFHLGILRASWHLPSFLACAQAVTLVAYGLTPETVLRDCVPRAVVSAMSISVACSGFLVLLCTKGRHQGGTALLIAATLMAFGLLR